MRICVRNNCISSFYPSSNILLLQLSLGVSVSNVLCMLSFIVGYIPDTKGGPPVSAESRIGTATVILNWLKRVSLGNF